MYFASLALLNESISVIFKHHAPRSIKNHFQCGGLYSQSWGCCVVEAIVDCPFFFSRPSCLRCFPRPRLAARDREEAAKAAAAAFAPRRRGNAFWAAAALSSSRPSSSLLPCLLALYIHTHKAFSVLCTIYWRLLSYFALLYKTCLATIRGKKNCQKYKFSRFNLASFWKPEAWGQTALPDKFLAGKSKWVILINALETALRRV